MHKAWRVINDENRRDLPARALRGLARLASWGYGLGAGLNQLSYDLGWREVIKMPVPVIGIGNITVGGSGKTPLTMEVVKTLLAMGHKVAIISRGYGRQGRAAVSWVSCGSGPLLSARQSGDEPYLLASRLPVPVLVGADRVKLVRTAIEQLGRVVIVGDDLFQHRRLYRDLDILTLDAARPLGNGFLLPRGPLREPRSALRRAQAIVLTRAETDSRDSRTWLRSFWGQGTVLECSYRFDGLFTLDGQALPPGEQGPVLAFCGLARPEAFAQSVAGYGLKLAGLVPFADHHWYSEQDLRALGQQAIKLGAKALLTTEKDAVRLPRAHNMPLWVSRLRLNFKDNGLAGLLAGYLKDKL